MDEMTNDYRRFFLRYRDLLTEIYRLEGKNGLIQQAFKEWGDETLKDLFVRKPYSEKSISRNILLKQENAERQQKKCNSLRFFAPYYDEKFIDISKGKLPIFFRTKNLGLNIKMPKKSTDIEIQKEAKKRYDSLSKEQKQEENAKIFKATAIVYARQANILNRFKESTKREYSSTMKEKHIAMGKFMLNAIFYNSIVPEEKQILFGISKSDKRTSFECKLTRIY